MSRDHGRPLRLVREARVAELLGRDARLEASGVLVRDGVCLVVSDNTGTVAVLDDRLARPGPHRALPLRGGRGTGYEDVTADTATDRLFVLIEALPEGPPYRACVEEYDGRYRLVASKPVDVPLDHANKGIEGLSCVRRHGRTHLLGLCEADGRIRVLVEGDTRWDPVATLRLPRDLGFRDYAGIAVSGDRIVVVSQESSALWTGRLDPDAWTVDGEGTVHDFPRDDEGRPRYAEVEGVSWLGPRRVVVVSDRAKRRARAGARRHEQSIAVFDLPRPTPEPPPRRDLPVRGLFQQRFDGDHALLDLTRTRFAQAGMPAEVYAGTPGQLADLLRIAPASPVLPTVHLDRRIDVRTEDGRAAVRRFTTRFAGRIAGVVVHDRAAMAESVPEVVGALRSLGRPDGPTVFLEYAGGMDPCRFVEIGERLRDVDGVGLCIDTGHVGIRRAHRRFAALHPDLRLDELSVGDPRLPGLADDVQDAVNSALPAVLGMIAATAELRRTVHFHLHDGHPLVTGLPDHRSFLFRLPVPFVHGGRYSLDPLYGPDGLARILRAAAATPAPPSLTLEIHQTDGRVPLADAAPLFRHWRDTTNAERQNHLLAVIAADHVLATSVLAAGSDSWPTGRADDR